ncbi:hypothetical protein BDW74DRAFT_183140 [Aspergillus multicolor]|uniref:uncharacterized protein n=1 Tax=Aspergillus multicolor TaxID=41759 RepID=UPI003CCE3AA5
MFCLRSWLPLLFIPTNASPLFLISFVTLTYLLHRPCIYCSALLVILFASTCNWSDRCFLNLRSDWFAPRYTPCDAPAQSDSLAGYIFDTLNSTAKALAGAMYDETSRRLSGNDSCSESQQELTGFGLEWLRSLVGRREWTLPCVDVKVRI